MPSVAEQMKEIAAAGRPPQRMEQRTDQRLTLTDSTASRFEIPASRIPDGMDYQWVSQTIFGQPDPRQSVPAAMNHWVPVPMRRHPELVGPALSTATPDAAIIIDGLMLCERPKYLTEERRNQERRAAASQVGEHMARLGQAPEGTLSDGGKRSAQVRSTFDRMVPEDS